MGFRLLVLRVLLGRARVNFSVSQSLQLNFSTLLFVSLCASVICVDSCHELFSQIDYLLCFSAY